MTRINKIDGKSIKRIHTFCVARFGGGGFRSYSAADISSNDGVESASMVNNGESQRLFAIGSSYRKINASNISRVYGIDELSVAWHSI